MKPCIQTQYSQVEFKNEDYNGQITMTVPDQTLSIQQIVENHVRGLPNNLKMREPIFLGDEEYYPPINSLDEIDKHDMLSHAKSTINAIQTEFAEQKKRKTKQKKCSKRRAPILQRSWKKTPQAGDGSTEVQSGA